MPAITNTVIGPTSRVLVTVTRKGRQVQYTATVIEWDKKTGKLVVLSDAAGEKQRIKHISGDSAKLLKQ